MKSLIFKILILLIIILGSFLRLYDVKTQSYWMDEGYTVNAILSIQENGNTILDSGNNYFCPIYCYPTYGFVKTFGNTPFAYRLLSIIAGIFLIIVIFLVTKSIFNKNIAFLAMFFTSFSYWQIAWSRQARWYTLFALFSILAIFYFYNFLYKQKNKKLNFSFYVLFITLSILTHRLGFLLLFSNIAWIILDYFFYKSINLKKYKIYILSLILITFFIDYFFKFYFIVNIFSNIQLNYTLPYYLNFYLKYYWFFIFFIILLFFQDKKNKRKYLFFIFPFIFNLLILSFFTNTVHYRYLFYLTPLLYILASVGIFMIINNLKNNKHKIFYFLFFISIFFISKHCVYTLNNFYFLESDNPKNQNRPYYAYTPQANFNKAYKYIEENYTNQDIVISSHPHFNKIFLQKPGYWLKYKYNGVKYPLISNDKEYYVNADVIDDLSELKNITKNKHGYIVFDFMSTDDRISQDIIKYIQSNMQLVFFDEINLYSKIWVYKF